MEAARGTAAPCLPRTGSSASITEQGAGSQLFRVFTSVRKRVIGAQVLKRQTQTKSSHLYKALMLCTFPAVSEERKDQVPLTRREEMAQEPLQILQDSSESVPNPCAL